MRVHGNTVDVRNSAPPGIYKTPMNTGISTTSTGAGFLPSTAFLGGLKVCVVFFPFW